MCRRISESEIGKMRKLHSQGWNYNRIAKYLNRFHSSIRYHLDSNAREKMTIYNRSTIGRRRELLRLKVVEKLGGKCAHCGITDKRVLQLDHINGGGGKERKKGIEAYAIYRRAFLIGDKEFQILCANCNIIKARVNNEYKRKYG